MPALLSPLLSDTEHVCKCIDVTSAPCSEVADGGTVGGRFRGDVLAGDIPVLMHNAPDPDPFGLPRAPGAYIITLDNGDKYVGQAKNLAE